jgi:hypothetical protein
MRARLRPCRSRRRPVRGGTDLQPIRHADVTSEPRSLEPGLAQHPLARLAELGRAVSADVPGRRMEMRYTAPPSELAGEPGSEALVNEAWMLRLERLGYERTGGASPGTSSARPTSDRRPRPPDRKKDRDFAHSIVSGLAWEPTPWRTVQRTAWPALR